MDIEVIDKGCLDYADFLLLQHRLYAQAVEAKKNTLLFCSHPPVYTLGRQTRLDDFLVPLCRLGVPLYHVQRGGRVAYHDLGQLMVYPSMDISRQFNRSIKQFTGFFIRVLKAALKEIAPGIEEQDDGLWLGSKKILFMGLGFRKWVSIHGFSINITTRLGAYQYIKPCGRSISVDNLSSFIREATQKKTSIFSTIKHNIICNYNKIV